MPTTHRNITALFCAFASGLAAGVARAELGVPISPVRVVQSNSGPERVQNGAPDIAADGHGVWISVFSSQTIVNLVADDRDILFTRSLDSGEHWSIPAPVSPDSANDNRDEASPTIATDGQGHWVAAWQSNTPGSDSDILTSRSIDNGANWSSAAPLNTNAANAADDIDPAIATDGKGLWIAVWASDDSLGNTIGNDKDILYARSTNNGATWTDPKPLNTNAGGDSAGDSVPRIAADGEGHWIVVWTVGDTVGSIPDTFFARSIDNGDNWSSPAFLTNGATTAADYAPTVATDRLGHWVAAWESYPAPDYRAADILVTRSLDNGANWSLPVPLNTTAGAADVDDFYTHLAADRLGNWVAVWVVENNVDDQTPPNDDDIFVARSLDFGGTWSSPTHLNLNFETDANADGLPRIATDGRGEWVTVWSSQELTSSASDDTEVFAAHFALPDCNQNLIGDPLETAAGISPDINGNSVPDFCEVLGLPPAGGGCGGGPCGVGAAAFGPLTMLSIAIMRRPTKRGRKGA